MKTRSERMIPLWPRDFLLALPGLTLPATAAGSRCSPSFGPVRLGPVTTSGAASGPMAGLRLRTQSPAPRWQGLDCRVHFIDEEL